ncbi:DUF2125 domain-containing protein [Sagittula stellata]|nr:DUF2125 domain-containing protein [Sagittula stellata]
MKRYMLVLIGAAVLWGGYWGVQAHTLRGEIQDWFETRRAEGWVADYDALQVRGFPSRLDVTIAQPRLADPDSGVSWEAPFLQILGLSYKPDHVIVAFPDRQTVGVDGGAHEVTSDGLRASLVTGQDGALLRLNAEAETLNIRRDGADIALAAVLANFHRLEGQDTTYRLAIGAGAVATPKGALSRGRANGLDIEGRFVFDSPWTLGALAGPRPQPASIDLAKAEYRLNDLDLQLAGRVEVDSLGRPDGRMTLRAENWRNLLDHARDSGNLPEALADTLIRGLTLAAGLNGRQDTIDLPLTLSGGEVSLGIIPLGKAPRIRLP